MRTIFSSLDFSRQMLVARYVSETYKMDLGREVSVGEIIRLFNAYHVEVKWAENESFEILSNDRLELALKSILSSM